jgi:hypothetical protein
VTSQTGSCTQLCAGARDSQHKQLRQPLPAGLLPFLYSIACIAALKATLHIRTGLPILGAAACSMDVGLMVLQRLAGYGVVRNRPTFDSARFIITPTLQPGCRLLFASCIAEARSHSLRPEYHSRIVVFNLQRLHVLLQMWPPGRWMYLTRCGRPAVACSNLTVTLGHQNHET